MLIFISHKNGGIAENMERAKKITHDLLFSHLRYGEIGHTAERELCLDILSNCDKLIVASDVSEGVRNEIDFAELVGMEIEYLENTNRMQP